MRSIAQGRLPQSLSNHEGRCKRRHTVENCIQRINEKRAFATRIENLASCCLVSATVAVVCDWLR
jgi:hypothetical protein